MKQLATFIFLFKRSYPKNQFNNSVSGPRSTWKTLNNILNYNLTRSNIKLKDKGISISDPIEIATNFNTHFS